MNSPGIRLILVFFMCMCLASAPAQESGIVRSSVTENYKGKPYFVHFVKLGETLPSIAKAYGISIDELKTDNPIALNGIHEDMVLMIRQVNPAASAVTEKPTPAPVEKPVPAPVVTKPEAVSVHVKTEISKKIEPAILADTAGYQIYTVKSKETLYGISRQFGLTIDDVLSANPGFTELNEGMQLRIPKVKPAKPKAETSRPSAGQQPPDSVTVKQGETLYSIAKMYNTTVDELIDLNRAKLNDGLKTGMVILLRKPSPVIKKQESFKENPPAAESPVQKQGPCYSADNQNHEYKIALLLPLALDEANTALDAPAGQETSGLKSYEYFQFYAGFMLAADTLEHFGLKASLRVLDADKLNDTLVIREALRKTGMEKTDLIVGPMFASSFNIAARFSRKNHIGIVNPLSKRENIVESNPWVFKVQPPSSALAEKLVQEICRSFTAHDIILVSSDNKDLNALAGNVAQLLKTAYNQRTFVGNVKETSFTQGIAGVKKLISPESKTAVVFFANNKEIVSGFISLLNPGSVSEHITLIGMDGWEAFDLDPEILTNLNYRQLSSWFIDYDSPEVKAFVARFRKGYGAYPEASKYAFLGYDIGMYFLTSLLWYGTGYKDCINENTFEGLQYRFRFERPAPTSGYVNKSIHMLRLENYKMVAD